VLNAHRCTHLHAYDLLDLVLGQGVKDDELIHTVDELWAEVGTALQGQKQ